MSSTVSVTPLTLEIRPSRYLAYYVLGVYAAAGLVMVILPLSAYLIGAALSALLLFCVLTFQTHVSLRRARADVGLNRRADCSWQLRLGDGTVHQARLLTDSYFHPELLVLNFRLVNGKRRSVVLVRESADRVGLRRLRVALTLGVPAAIE